MDLEAEHLDVRTCGGEACLQLESRDSAGAVAEVHHQRVRRAAEGRMAGDPAIHPPESVAARGPARHLTDGRATGRHEPMMPGRSRHPPLDIMGLMTAPYT